MQGIKDTFDYGVKVTGVTVHFVDNELDNGPIIIQAVEILENDTIETLERKIHEVDISSIRLQLNISAKICLR